MTEKCILLLRRRGGDDASKLEWIKYWINEAASLGRREGDEGDLAMDSVIDRDKSAKRDRSLSFSKVDRRGKMIAFSAFTASPYDSPIVLE